MAGVPRFRSLRIEDIDINNTEAAFQELISYISRDMETLSSALQNDITFEQNVAMVYKEYSFTTPSDYTSNFTTSTIPHNLRSGQAKHVQISQILKTGQATSVTSLNPISVDWYDNGSGSIVVKRISGLEPSTQYTVRLFIA